MGMTLDEVIELLEQIVDGNTMDCEFDVCGRDSFDSVECTHCYIKQCNDTAKESRQLAEWLKKLKAYEEAREEIGCLPIVWKEDAGVRKCIGILDKHLMEVTANDID